MTMHCGKCGAELLGAVNRCWKCGLAVVSRADGMSAPPVRRPPVDGPLEIPPWEALAAVIVDDEPRPTEPGAKAARASRGSPFTAGANLTPADKSRRHRGAQKPSPLAPTAARHGAPVAVERPPGPLHWLPSILAVAFAGGSFSIQDYPEIAFATSLVALGLAIFSLVRRINAWGAIALLLCLLAVTRGGYSTFVTVFERVYGRSPWATEDEYSFEVEPEPDATDDGRLK